MGTLDAAYEAANEALCAEVLKDFDARQAERRRMERGWELNLKFVRGEQYCFLSDAGEFVSSAKKYDWEQRRVFNHVATVVDTRLSKLSMIRPALTVRAASDDESDRHSASLAAAILASVAEDGDLDGVISEVSNWSEICGTGFYKVTWDSTSGVMIASGDDGKKLKQGNVKVAAVPPFEIYPADLFEEKLEAQSSIIHARAVSVRSIAEAYGVKLAGRELKEFRSFGVSNTSELADGYELVIERYERPTDERPEGRLTVVAGGRLLYDGELPYVNGADGVKGYPFVKQTSVSVAGEFFGNSVVDRLIPLQRAYNAVKNRKHEYLNRISMGTVAVEDGSVDVDELADSGLEPGKIIVYRQGGTPPEALSLGNVPEEFWKEEESLLKEFARISGTEDLTEASGGFSGVTSATGLQLLIEQNDARLNVAYESLKRAIKAVGRQILRLFRQFATDVRLLKYAGANNALSLYYFKGSDISSDDVTLNADADSNLTPAQRREVVFELMDRGLFAGADGKISVATRNKILETLGYASLAGERDLGELHRARAGEENLKLKSGECAVKEYDDHATHISEHTTFLLTEELSPEAEERICRHIGEHKIMEVSDGRGDS